MLTIYVRYEIEVIDDGWLVWRTVDGRDTEALTIGRGRRARVFGSRLAAEEEIETQRRVDKGAATRLGVTLG